MHDPVLIGAALILGGVTLFAFMYVWLIVHKDEQ